MGYVERPDRNGYFDKEMVIPGYKLVPLGF